MTYILSEQRDGDGWRNARLTEYLDYLKAHAGCIPDEALAILTSSWYYRLNDDKSPHDRTLYCCSVKEFEYSEVNIEIVLASNLAEISPIVYEYSGVTYYKLTGLGDSEFSHGGWLFDEVIFEEKNNLVTHMIEWGNGSNWKITASSFNVFFNRE